MSNINFENQGMVKIDPDGEKTCIRVKCELGDEVPEIKKLERLDFIKIDTEGFELEVLRGLEHTIGKFNPIILLEFDNQLGVDLMPLSNWIKEHNYKIATVKQPNVFLGSSDLLKPDFSENIILTK